MDDHNTLVRIQPGQQIITKMSKPTKLQKETLEIIREELNLMKKCDNINATTVFTVIDKGINSIKEGTMDPQLEEKHADRLSDILYEIVTFIRDLER